MKYVRLAFCRGQRETFIIFFLKFSSQHPISQRPYLIKKEVRHKTKQTGNEIRLRVEY